MIKLIDLIKTIQLLETKTPGVVKSKKPQTTGHMTHMGDWAIYGDPNKGLEHYQLMQKFLNGEETKNHSVSWKFDGGWSFTTGRTKEGHHFIMNKNAKKMLKTEDEIDAANVPWAKDAKLLLRHIKQMPIEPGKAYQGDLLWARHEDKVDDKVRPNTVTYNATPHGVGIAIHSEYDVDEDNNLVRTSNAPNVENLKHDNVLVVDPKIKVGDVMLTPTRNRQVTRSLKRAESELTPEVQDYAKSIAGDKKLHKFMQEYLNEVVATTGKRSHESIATYLTRPIHGARTSYGYMEKSTQRKMSDKGRSKLQQELEDHIEQNKPNITKLLMHMQHLADAKHIMLQQFHESKHIAALVPHGNGKHEGVVSALGTPNETGELQDVNLAKMTEEGINGFSAQNRRRGIERGFSNEREQPHPNVPFVDHTEEEELKEEMSVGGGGIAGIGGPEDVAVPVKAQRRYTKSGPMRRRRKIIESFLNSNNFMK